MRNPVIGWVSSEWAPVRRNPATGAVSPHAGIDIAAPVGTPVYAAFAGVVEEVRTNSYSGDPFLWRGLKSGNFVRVRNPDGERQWYGHLDKVHVKTGQRVTEGQQIGTCGKTGRVTGPHLHFECWRSGSVASHANPRKWFKAHGITPGIETITAAASTTVNPSEELTVSQYTELKNDIAGLEAQIKSLRESQQSKHVNDYGNGDKTNVNGALTRLLTLVRRVDEKLEKES